MPLRAPAKPPIMGSGMRRRTHASESQGEQVPSGYSSPRRARAAGWLLGLIVVMSVCPVSIAIADEATEGAEAPPPPAPAGPSGMTTLLGYGLSIGGSLVVLALVIHTLSKNMKYESARNALIHLLRTNPNLAEAQCLTMPNTFFDAIGAAIRGGAMTGTQDPAIIATATTPSYDAVGGVVSQHWKGLVGKAKLAALAACGALFVKPAILIIVLAVLTLGGLAWLFWYKAEVDRTIMRARVEVMPDVDRAFVDGRYHRAG